MLRLVLTEQVYNDRYGLKYLGRPVCRCLYIIVAVLKMERYLIGSQCNDFSVGVTCENLEVLVTMRAREFCMHWSLFMSLHDKLRNKEL